jgi:hypothetical protein
MRPTRPSTTATSAAFGDDRATRLAALAPALVFLIAALVAVPDVGISVDEPLHFIYGEGILRFFATLGRDRTLFEIETAAWYGGIYDAVATLAAHALPGVPRHLPPHVLTILIATAAIYGTGRMAGLLGGAGAAAAAATLLVLTARWSGHALFDPKDIPFSAGYVAALYAVQRWTRELPRPRARLWIGVALGTAAALAVRVAGLLALFYLAVVAVVHAVRRSREERFWAAGLRLLFPLAPPALVAGASAFALTIAGWPYLWEAPLANFVTLARVSSDFPWHGSVFFLGQFVRAGETGPFYIPIWLAVGLPLATFAGLALALLWAALRRLRVAGPPEGIAVLLLGALFPIAWVMASDPVLYNGFRHLLFVVPPLCVLAALGLRATWLAAAGRPRLRIALAVALFALVAEPAAWLLRSHPYQYVYFNPLAGGLARASHWFSGDYWRLSLRAAAIELDRLADAEPGDGPVDVRVLHKTACLTDFLRPGSRVRLARNTQPEGRQARLELEFTQERIHRALERRAARIIYAERVVPGQIPFFVILRSP